MAKLLTPSQRPPTPQASSTLQGAVKSSFWLLHVSAVLYLCFVLSQLHNSLPHSPDDRAVAPVQVPAPEVVGTATNHDKDNHKDKITLDFLSIGSVTRPQYLAAQERTFGSHKAVRHFMPIMEHYDHELDCNANLTTQDALDIVKRCSDPTTLQYPLLADIAELYMKPAALLKKTKPAGWICAQKRPIDSLMKYYTEKLKYDPARSNESLAELPYYLPDYLMILDDDTYVRVDDVLETLQQQQEMDIPSATAGCLIRSQHKNFSLPLGGFGTILNRNALQRFATPIYCSDANHNQNVDLAHTVCTNLQANLIGEQLLFQDGMSVLDLMVTYTHDQPFTKHNQWNAAGFCLASDTTLGYFLNRYVLPQPSEQQHQSEYQVDENYIQGYMGSTYYLGKPPKHPVSIQNRRQCFNQQIQNCWPNPEKKAPAHICHYISDEQMHRLWGLQEQFQTEKVKFDQALQEQQQLQ